MSSAATIRDHEIAIIPIPTNHRINQGYYAWFQTLLSFIGPGYMVAVGYFDPGNWATDLAAGSKYGYRLLFVILMSNLMAVLLQNLCIRLGVVTGNDLAQSCAKYFPRWLSLILYVLCEIAIIATDLAEVIGSAIALNLLFKLPYIYGVLITAGDVMFILLFWETKNLRYFEAMIMVLVVFTAGCLFAILAQSSPVLVDVLTGFLPSTKIVTEPGSIYVAVGIIGATVMPHNLYLHSSIVKYRSGKNVKIAGEIADMDIVEESSISVSSEEPLNRKSILRTTLQMSSIDSFVALTFALAINASILIIAAANFYTIGRTDIAEIPDAFNLIGELLGKGFAYLFAIGLLLAGQSSTITGTLAGQIIMEGFLGSRFKIKPWIRRLVTRLVAVVPALVCIYIYGESRLNDLLILSQIVLSLQLPFAVWPLIYFTSSKIIMTFKSRGDTINEFLELVDDEQSLANNWVTMILAILIGVLVTIFNIILLIEVGMGNT